MNTRGLMGLVVANVGRDLGVIPDSVFCMLTFMALATTFMTTPLLLRFRGSRNWSRIFARASLGQGCLSIRRNSDEGWGSMKAILDILLFPAGLFIEAFVAFSIRRKARMRRNRKLALLFLAACLGVFGLVIVDATIQSVSPALIPLIVLGLVCMFAFLIAGKACSDESERSKK